MDINNNMNIERTEQEIYAVIDQCAESINTGGTAYPSMNYEQGVRAAIEWLIGNTDDHPINE